MKVRTRLGLTTVGAALVTAAGLLVAESVSQTRAAEAELEGFTRSLMESEGWLAQCDAAPASWTPQPPRRPRRGAGDAPPHSVARPEPPPGHVAPPPPPGLETRRHRKQATFAAYASDFSPLSPGAGPLSAETIAALESLPVRDVVPVESSDGDVKLVLRTSPTPGRQCAFILATGTQEPWLGALLPKLHIWLLPLLAVCAAVLVAVGPIVRRLRRLAAAMHGAAARDYAVDVREAGRFGDDEIGELADAFDAAAHEVRARLIETRQREQALRDFVANTTHDLMIPLTVLQGHLARLASNASSDGSSVVGAAMGEAHYIGALVHNLAIAAKLESGAPSPERHLVDLPALVARVVARHRPIARGLSVALDAATPTSLSVLGDETMLEQAVSNLVHNAIRYNRPGGHVAIVLEASRPAAPGAFSLSVIDDGPGVSDDVLERLRERGFRGDDARNRAPGGHGLGLDITSRVARLHHMRLDLRRSEFGGLHAELIAPDAATTPESGTV